jgi:hypothetical protein
MPSPAQMLLIEEIMRICYNNKPKKAKPLLGKLFEDRNVSTAIIQTWNDDAMFDKIETGHSSVPTGSTPAPLIEDDQINKREGKKGITYFSAAGDDQVEDALKRLGYPDPPDAA